MVRSHSHRHPRNRERRSGADARRCPLWRTRIGKQPHCSGRRIHFARTARRRPGAEASPQPSPSWTTRRDRLRQRPQVTQTCSEMVREAGAYNRARSQ